MRNENEVLSLSPAYALPESPRPDIVGVHEEVASDDAFPLQASQDLFAEGATETTPSVRGRNGEVMEITAATVVTSKHGPNDPALVESQEAQAWIAVEVAREPLSRVHRAKCETLGPLPQGHDLFIVR